MPEFTLRASEAATPRLDFSAPPIEVTPGPPPSGKLSRRLDMHGEFPPDAIPAPEMSLSVLSDLRPLGQIHESFIIAAGRDGLWIIDQHVAHERILFEQVLKQRAAGRVETQRLLMPMILTLTAEQQNLAKLTAEVAEHRGQIEQKQQAFRDTQLQLNQINNEVEQHKTAILDLMRRSAAVNNRF